MTDRARQDQQTGEVREFTIHAIPVDIVYNKYGLHQPPGAMYVLEENLEEARRASGVVPDDAYALVEDGNDGDEGAADGGEQKKNDGACGCDVKHDDKSSGEDDCPDEDVDTRIIEPLVIRANEGDTVKICFKNHLDRHASIHNTALPYQVEDSDGMAVGFNPDTTAAPGETIHYTWQADSQGTHFFFDGANQAYDSADEPPEEANLFTRGLFGAITVHPPGTTYTDPHTGEPLRSGLQADIHPPNIPDYREVVVFYHTPEGIETADGGQVTFPNSDEEQTTHAINYRADPTGQRLREDCPDCDREASFYNSWAHGDPGGGDNVYEAYVGDPVKFAVVGASAEENHVHHLHNHRWFEERRVEDSDTIDSQTIGMGSTIEAFIVAANGSGSARPDMTFEEAFEVGAGGAHGSAGDMLFHCHLFPHYGEGMWGMMRVHDKERDDLVELPSNEPPISEDSDVPGFPEFIPGEIGVLPPFPPYEGVREPTPEEEQALTRKGPIVPGAPYTDPCEPDVDNTQFGGPAPEDGEVREYTIVGLPADIVYNDAGHHDPEGKVYVLEEDAEAVRNGEMNPEPLVIRANVNDCVDITLKNEIPGGDGKSNHIHFVSYDVLGSDSLQTGYNYSQYAEPDDEAQFRWYADEEGTIFFHDHITGIDDVMNGTFCSLIVEPEDSEWLDPYTGDPIRSGTQAMIKDPNGEDFREQALLFHDFAPLVDRDGEFVNPDFEHNVNEGVMAINYRNTPYYIREDPDPAYVHSSHVHGDPSTPVFEAYPEDPIRIRLVQTAYEEQHNFQIHGMHFNSTQLDSEDAITQQFGTSEAFTFRAREQNQNTVPTGAPPNQRTTGTPGQGNFERIDNPDGLPIRDYLYGSGITDDLWDGMWGLIRIYGKQVDHLQPLPDQQAPDEKITRKQLKDAGIPAAFDDRGKIGQKARLLYDEDDDRRFPPDKDARKNPSITGSPPPKAPSPGDPCPDSDQEPDRVYNITAFETTIPYNDYGDQDPLGVVYALDENVEDIKAGRCEPEPLLIRAHGGDCIEINLTNELPEDRPEHAHPQMRTNKPWEESNRISLHPVHIRFDVNASDGATVGFNWDQTVEPGETITYRWFAEEDDQTSVLYDMADIRSHRHHGAYGRLIVEPPGTVWLDSRTGEPTTTSSQAIIKNPDGPDFREFALAFADGQYIVNPNTDTCVVPAGFDEEEGDPDAPCNQNVGAEDQGYGAINYRSEPFIRRFDENPEQHLVYSSKVHGDPNTPVLNAFLDDPVQLRVHMTADRARGLSYHVAAHQWNFFRGLPESDDVGVDDRLTPGQGLGFNLLGGAGGRADSVGDHIYQELKERRRLESGMWGIFRVGDGPDDFQEPVQPLPEVARKRKIRPKDRRGWVTACGDVTGDGKEDVVIAVPDSVHGPCGASALYVFLGPVKKNEICDLSDADVRMVGHVDCHCLHLDVHVDGKHGVDTVDSLLTLLSGGELELENCEAAREVFCDLDLDKLRKAEKARVAVSGGGKRDERMVAFDVSMSGASGEGPGDLTVTLGERTRLTVKGCPTKVR
ncbi:multicopper oxidase domain-containing protein [Halegenticoccus soli]|uniref:multicopper oxidase domain-containing protein n=1 Tax=Halegenticoccus soli TaxID=1985678 RepID=UPI00117AFFE6|nr:multicopper oxidase domain-containing protein [Halegenticoccus soli]